MENATVSTAVKNLEKAIVSTAVEKINDLLVKEAKFLYGVEDQVTELQIELIRMQCFLEDVEVIRYKNRTLRNWIAEIKDLVYKSEIVLDTFLFEVQSRRRGGFRGKVRRFACFFNELVALHKVRSEIEFIKNKLNNLSTRFQIYGIRDMSAKSEASSSSRYEKLLMERRTYSDVVEDDFVDLPNVTRKLVGDLVREDKHYKAISIYGIGGSGKTTFAKQIYRHKDVRRHFDAFAWAHVSQQPKKGDILRGILKELGKEPPQEENDLIRELLEIQRTKKCLVVLDDIWSIDDWKLIKAAFSNRGDETGSIIFLTTRNKVVAEHIDPGGLHDLPLLDEEQSWNLFCKKAHITESTIAEDQKELAEKILKRCRGLPLAIVVLGGLLRRKQKLEEWKTVYENINLYLKGDKVFAEQTEGVIDIFALSYYDLPHWLKPCFLYLGNYPENYEISAYTLYQLWIAEGFISPDEERKGKETLMNVAERYLGELAQRSMVQVQMVKVEDRSFEDRSFGRFKSCRLHDLMREMCLSIVKEENFLKVIDHGQSSERQSRSSSSSSTLGSKIHRLAIHGNKNIDPSNLCIDQEKNIRAVLFCDGNKCTPQCRQEFVSNLPKNFKLVRVMHLEEFGSDKEVEKVELPNAVGDLIHLRYFRLGAGGGPFKLPSSIGKLGYLQTLDLSSLGQVTIPNVLWKLKQLMHLYFPWSWEPVKDGKLRLDGLDNLEVLHRFNSRFFIVEDLQKLINLRSLTGVRIKENQQDLKAFVNYLMSVTRKQLLLGHSSLFIDRIDFRTEDRLALLKQIFFECHPLHDLRIDGRIRELPVYQESFHSSLTHLSLSGAELEKDPMAILEKLPDLAVLKLWNNAYKGKEMVCSVQGFPRLKKLFLGDLWLLEDWRVEEEAMPNLSYLEIGDCSELKMVPNGLRCITTLQELSIVAMPQAFVNRLKSPDGADFDKVSHIPSIRVEYTVRDLSGSNEEYQDTIEYSVE